MHGRIAHLHARYRVYGDHATTSVTGTRLDRVLRESLVQAYAAALEQALGDDPAVYVVRDVSASLSLRLTQDAPDSWVARHWGASLARATLATIARWEGEPARGIVRRFADQADYVAHCLSDLLDGIAPDAWFYAPLVQGRHGHLSDTLRLILLEQREHLPMILAQLRHSYHVEPLLRALDVQSQRQMWSDLRADARLDEAACQPLFAAAVELGSRLDLWPTPPAPDTLAAYLATQPGPADWRDPADLARAVFAILRFLAGPRPVSRAATADPSQAEAHEQAQPAYIEAAPPSKLSTLTPGLNQALASRVEAAVRPLDWLDTDRLRHDLLTWLEADASASVAVTPDLPTRPRPVGPTPRQRALIEHLEAALRAGELRLDPSVPDAPANALRADARLDEAACQPLFAAAVELGSRLDLWPTPPAPDTLAAYLATQPGPADWRDPADLARAVFAILRFLVGLRPSCARQQGAAPGPALASRVDAAVRPLDWLDTDHLRHDVLVWLTADAPRQLVPRPSLPLRPTLAAPTPRQRRLIGHLLAVLHAGQLRLDAGAPASPANALRWYAALVEADPAWAGDALAADVIQRLLAGWAVVRDAVSLRAVAVLDADQPSAVAVTWSRVEALGEPGLTVLAALAGMDLADVSGAAPATVTPAETKLGSAATASDPDANPLAGRVKAFPHLAAATSIDTASAGIALIVRALLDTRLPSLASDLDYPSGEDEAATSLLLALYLRWAGPAALLDGAIDPGLLCLAGGLPTAVDAVPLDTLRATLARASAPQHAAFQVAWTRSLMGQRLLAPSILRLYHLPDEDSHRLIVAGDASAVVWPLGRALDASESVADLLHEWRAVWVAATGSPPDRILIDESLAVELHGEAGIETASDADADEQNLHLAGRQQLLVALTSLEVGRLGLPDLDLTVDLVAASLLRLWARWLHRFSESTIPYLLQNFLRRPGRMGVNADTLDVEMMPGPFDMIIEMAGYLAPTDRVPWLDQRRVRFHLRG